MPVFNGASYIEAAIRSLLAQKFKNFELIIADNHSTDETFTIIKKYAKKDIRLKYFRHSKNEGGLYNFEYVKNKAQGEYFMWAAHDDVWKEDHLSLAVKSLKSDHKVAFVFPTFILQSINFKFNKVINRNVFKFIESDDMKVRVLGYVNLHHASHKCNLVYSLFRREFINDVYKLQNLENDGLLSSLILGASKGKVLNEHTFKKRYKYYWPGFLFNQIYWIKKCFGIDIVEESYRVLLKEGTDLLISKFPQFETELLEIQRSYFVNYCPKNYKLIDNEIHNGSIQ